MIYFLILEKICLKLNHGVNFEKYINDVLYRLKFSPPSTRDILLVIYIEEVIDWLVKSENVIGFLNTCFN